MTGARARASTLRRRYTPRAARPIAAVAHGGDRWIVATVVVLAGLGIVMVFNTSYFFASERFAGDSYYLFRKHLFSIALGGLCAAVASRLSSRTCERLAYPALAIVTVALIAVLIPEVGLTRGGARRWIGLGMLNLQPSEFAKLAVVLYLARSIVRKRERMQTFEIGVLPHVIVVGVLSVMIAIQPDFGTAAVLGMLLMAMLFVGRARLRDLTGLVGAAVLVFAYAIVNSPYRWQRIIAFLNPWAHPQDVGFQLVQSFVAFGSGGILGAGLGASKQKMFYVPEAHTDFIFSVMGEELGLIGALALVGMFALLAARGLRVAFRHPTPFGQMVAFGLTVSLTLQAAINMAVVLGLVPTKGLALPFVSYGGSAMVSALTSTGLLLALSRESG